VLGFWRALSSFFPNSGGLRRKGGWEGRPARQWGCRRVV
jgi:hypothetical protein